VEGEDAFPESITSTRDGTLIAGSMVGQGIYRAPPGASRAELWIPPGAHGITGVFGVLADEEGDDEEGDILWVCSGKLGRDAPPSALYLFDLKSGAFRKRLELPTPGGLCSDIAVAPNGATYVTDAANMQVLRVTADRNALEVWANGPELGAKGAVLDGVAVVRDAVLVNTYLTGKLISIGIGPSGEAAGITEIKLDRTLVRPDGMRPLGPDLLVTEATPEGRLTRIQLRGERGVISTVREGFANAPNAVTISGNTAYVVEGQLSRISAPKETRPRVFQITPVPLP